MFLLLIIGSILCAPILHAVTTPQLTSGFLGCFRTNIIVSIPEGLQAPDLAACKQLCGERQESLTVYAMPPEGQSYCSCSNTLPDPEAFITKDANCISVLAAEAVALYYNWDGDGACELEGVPLTNETLEVAYGAENVELLGSGLVISLVPPGNGTRLHTRGDNTLYGMYQVDALASAESGVITAFYLRNDYFQETTNFSEIDYEWINGWPQVKSTVWLHSLTNGQSNGEHFFPPEGYQNVTGSSALPSTEGHTYTIDWQRGFVSWSMNNGLLKRQVVGESYQVRDEEGMLKPKVFIETPNLASHVTFSIWTCNEPHCGQFGGPLDPNGPFPHQSAFKNLRRVICQARGPVAAAAKG